MKVCTTPEGPEVECVKRDLQTLVNLTVEKATLTELALNYNRYIQQNDRISLLEKKKIVKIERRGKFIIWWFGKIPVVNHLGMTGGWIIRDTNHSDPIPQNHPKVVLNFSEGKKAIFDDVRNFGRFEIFHNEKELLDKTESIRKMGIDGLALPFPQNQFEQILHEKRNLEKTLGSFLLDQQYVAGVGNIYKSESLFKAKLHPVLPLKLLTNLEMKTLGDSISYILQLALNSGGTTIDNFQSPYGAEGKAQEWHQVYGREGKSCFICKTPIQRIIQKTRSTFFCPVCQPIREGLTIPENLLPPKKEQTTKKRTSNKKQKKKSTKKTRGRKTPVK